MGRGGRLRVLLLALLVAGGIFVQPASTSPGQSGGIFRISFAPQSGLDYIDPALSYTPPGWAILDTMCARLLTYPDRPPPKAFEAVPEVAIDYPAVADDFKKFTFRLRTGFRFSDGSPVRGKAFAHAINRTLAPGVQLTRRHVHARHRRCGRRPRRAEQDAPRRRGARQHATRAAHAPCARLRQPHDVAVLLRGAAGPPVRRGGRRRVPLRGPVLRRRVPAGERIVMRQNRFYGGKRARRVDGFEVDLRAPSPTEMIRRIDRGEADWGHTIGGVFMDPTLGARGEARRQPVAILRQAGARRCACSRSTRRAPVPQQPQAPESDQLRPRPSAPCRRPAAARSSRSPPTSICRSHSRVSGTPTIYPLARSDLGRAQALARGSLRGRRRSSTPPTSRSRCKRRSS